MRNRLNILLLLTASIVPWSRMVHAEPFNFPTLGGRNAQESISTHDGTICTQNVGGRASLNMGVYGVNRSTSNNNVSLYPQGGDNFGGFVMLNVPLNAPSRLNCAKLLEIVRRQLDQAQCPLLDRL